MPVPTLHVPRGGPPVKPAETAPEPQIFFFAPKYAKKKLQTALAGVTVMHMPSDTRDGEISVL